MTERADDQRIAERMAEENLWRANRLACVRHLVTPCHCVDCRAEREPHTSRATPYLRQPVTFWWTVLTAAGVAGVVAFVTFALEIKP